MSLRLLLLLPLVAASLLAFRQFDYFFIDIVLMNVSTYAWIWSFRDTTPKQQLASHLLFLVVVFVVTLLGFREIRAHDLRIGNPILSAHLAPFLFGTGVPTISMLTRIWMGSRLEDFKQYSLRSCLEIAFGLPAWCVFLDTFVFWF